MRRTGSRLFAAVALAVCVVCVTLAPSPGDAAGDVEKRLADGAALEKEHKYARAAELYRAGANLSAGSGASNRLRLALGRALVETGDLKEAIGWLELVVLLGQGEAGEPEARYLIGRACALLGDTTRAMVELQHLRNDHPGSPFSRRALDDLTLLRRFAVQAKIQPRKTFLYDDRYKLKSTFEDPVDIGVDGEGFVYVGDADQNNLFRFDLDGKLYESFRHGTIGHLFVDRHDRVYQIIGGNLWVNDRGDSAIKRFRMGGSAQEIKILDLCVSRSGELYILDEDDQRVMKFDKGGSSSPTSRAARWTTWTASRSIGTTTSTS